MATLDRQLISFLQADTLDEIRRLINHYPDLLSPEADARLVSFSELDDDEVRKIINAGRALLQRCREVGPDLAVAELRARVSNSSPKKPSGTAVISPSSPKGRPVGLFRVLLASVFGIGSTKLKANLDIYKAGQFLDDETENRPSSIETAIRYLEKALKRASPDRSPQEWAIAINNYANVYYLRVRGERAENLEICIQAAKLASESIDYHRFPAEWGAVMITLGKAYFRRMRNSPAEHINDAIRTYERALRLMTYERFPVQWGMLTRYLGRAYKERKEGDLIENLERAIAAYENLLSRKSLKGVSEGLDLERCVRELADVYEQRNRLSPVRKPPTASGTSGHQSSAEPITFMISSKLGPRHVAQGWRSPSKSFGSGAVPQIDERQRFLHHPATRTSFMRVRRLLIKAVLVWCLAIPFLLYTLFWTRGSPALDALNSLVPIKRLSVSMVLAAIGFVVGGFFLATAIRELRKFRRLSLLYFKNSTHVEALGCLRQHLERGLPFAIYFRNFALEAAIVDLSKANANKSSLLYILPASPIEMKLSSALGVEMSLIGIDNPLNIYRVERPVIPRLC
ncbi:MAG TPA: hypothetical protein VI685_04440, partial [Candidatus Angelobacter sp.]